MGNIRNRWLTTNTNTNTDTDNNTYTNTNIDTNTDTNTDIDTDTDTNTDTDTDTNTNGMVLSVTSPRAAHSALPSAAQLPTAGKDKNYKLMSLSLNSTLHPLTRKDFILAHAQPLPTLSPCHCSEIS